jgi:Cd2+/Zn2+-exporting ATPase
MVSHCIRLPLVLPQSPDCERCAGRLREALEQTKGVGVVEVDVDASTLTFSYDPDLVQMEDVEHRAREIGVQIAQQLRCETLAISGFDCVECSRKLEKAVSRQHGVLWAAANYATGLLRVEYRQDEIARGDLIRVIRGLGYDAQLRTGAGEAAARGQWWYRNRIALMAGVSGAALLAGWLLARSGAAELMSRSCYLVALLAGGYTIARNALGSLRVRIVDINLLMGLAAVGALAIGQWLEAAMVAFLFTLGESLETYTLERTRTSIRSLLGLFPTEALVVREGGELRVPIEQVAVGERIIVRPGEKIPLDGRVVAGDSAVNQSPITGESIPVSKGPGDIAYAGTINGLGVLEIEVTHPAHDTTVSRIIALVEKAQAQRAPVQQFAERFGRIYTPVVVGIAVVVALAPPALHLLSWHDGIYRALTLLVVSCPCALVVSTPVTVVSALSNAARNGVLIKGGAYLQAAGSLRAIAFDKTGTLTRGRPEVSDVVSLDARSEREILAAAAGVERRSDHPMAAAIVRRAREADAAAPEVERFEAIPGAGAAADVNGQRVLVGAPALFSDTAAGASEAAAVLSAFQAEGKTAVLVGQRDRIWGAVAAADQPRDDARDALDGVRAAGVRHIVMLTGDNEATAGAIAGWLKIDDYRAGLLPEQKLEVVRQLRAEHHTVAMVGDGVNDAPALAAATVGIAMGTIGSDQALETADIALMADDLSKIPYAIRLSRRAVSVVRQNIAFSLAVVGALVVTTLLGHLRLSQGVMGHEGSALLVILNGMRLLRGR